jgi:hypothetical protein
MWTEEAFFLGAFAKLRKAAISFVMSVRLSVRPYVHYYGTTQLPMDGFLWNLVYEYFSKTCLENSVFIKIGRE